VAKLGVRVGVATWALEWAWQTFLGQSIGIILLGRGKLLLDQSVGIGE